jgi:hypothetical protein
VWGENTGAGYGVFGGSVSGVGVHGESQSPWHAGVEGINTNGGTGIYGSSSGGDGPAAYAGDFSGNVRVSGNLRLFGAQGQLIFISANDSTIQFTGDHPQIIVGQLDTLDQITIGTSQFTSNIQCNQELDIDAGSLVINSDLTVNGNAKFQGSKQGFLVDEFVNCSETVLERGDLLTLRRTEAKERYGDRIPIPQVELAHEAYAVAVCGVVDGPARQTEARRLDAVCAEVPPGARGLMVTIGCYADCKVDADVVPIEVGDLLTTSSTPGHAQKVLDRSRALGAIVGKALKAVEKGKAAIPILVLLH